VYRTCYRQNCRSLLTFCLADAELFDLVSMFQSNGPLWAAGKTAVVPFGAGVVPLHKFLDTPLTTKHNRHLAAPPQDIGALIQDR
jgi:hypothetical protein